MDYAEIYDMRQPAGANRRTAWRLASERRAPAVGGTSVGAMPLFAALCPNARSRDDALVSRGDKVEVLARDGRSGLLQITNSDLGFVNVARPAAVGSLSALPQLRGPAFAERAFIWLIWRSSA